MIDRLKKVPWGRLLGVYLIVMPLVIVPKPGYEVVYSIVGGIFFVAGVVRILRND